MVRIAGALASNGFNISYELFFYDSTFFSYLCNDIFIINLNTKQSQLI